MDRKKLENYRWTKIKIQDRLKELEEKKENVNRLVASYGGEKVSSSRLNEDGTAERLVEILDNTKEIENILKLWNLELIEIEKSIDKIENQVYQVILYKRYVLNIPLEDIAYDIGYDYKYVCRLHGLALNEFDKI